MSKVKYLSLKYSYIDELKLIASCWPDKMSKSAMIRILIREQYEYLVESGQIFPITPKEPE